MPRLTHVTDRGRETLRALRQAMFDLILERGFAQVTIKDIADRAGVDRTTFYLHCKDKQDLYLQSQQALLEELFQQVPTDTSLEERLQLSFAHIAEQAAAYRVLLSMSGDPADHQMHHYIATMLQAGLRHRLRDRTLSDDDIALTAQFITGALRSAARWWLEQNLPIPAEAMAQRVARLIAQCLHDPDRRPD